MNKFIILTIAGIIIIGGLIALISREQAQGEFDEFAQCIAEKQITMYGAEWCPHCQNEKKAFGDAFKYVPYVECPENPKLCIEKGIEGYPTWILPDPSTSSGQVSKRLVGEQGLEKLSQESGCPLQQNSSEASPLP